MTALESLKDNFAFLRDTGNNLLMLLNKIHTIEEKANYLKLLTRYERLYTIHMCQLEKYRQDGNILCGDINIYIGIIPPSTLVLFGAEP